MTATLTRAAAMLSIALTTTLVSAQSAPQQLPSIRISTGMHAIQVMVAQTPEQQATGLMFRKSMGTNEGMLFVFDEPRQQCFWMKNTLLPLSVAFIADDGSVVNLDDMKPQTEDSHCSTKPVRFVLEMNVGWFDKRGVKPGSRFQGDPFAK